MQIVNAAASKRTPGGWAEALQLLAPPKCLPFVIHAEGHTTYKEVLSHYILRAYCLAHVPPKVPCLSHFGKRCPNPTACLPLE